MSRVSFATRVRPHLTIGTLFVALVVGGLGVVGGPGAFGGAPVQAPPSLYFSSPTNDGEPIMGVFTLELIHTEPSAHELRLFAGSQQLHVVPVIANTIAVAIDTTTLSNGPTTLTGRLYDAAQTLLVSASREVVVANSTLELEVEPVPNAQGGRNVGVTVQGLPEDSIFVLLVSDKLETSYFSAYGLELPIHEPSTAILTAGLFPANYAGGAISFQTEIGQPGEPVTLHAVLVSWSPSLGWHASNVVPLDL